MNSDIQMVVNICIELSEKGKHPSVGMIKAKSSTPLPIPLIIKGLSYWKENKESLKKVMITNETKGGQSSNEDTSERVKALELLVKQLATQVKQGNDTIKTLQKQVTDLQQQVAVLGRK
jgi:uncharacterized protein HemX